MIGAYVSLLRDAQAYMAEAMLSKACAACIRSERAEAENGGFWRVLYVEYRNGLRYDEMRMTVSLPKPRIRLRWRHSA